jgi:NADH-quinone oxidoreductase subunit N
MTWGELFGNWPLMVPEICLFALALSVLAIDAFTTRRASKQGMAYFATFGAAAMIVVVAARGGHTGEAFGGMFVVDPGALLFKALFLTAAFLTGLASVHLAVRETRYPGEYYGLLLLSTLGLMIMVSAGDLMTLYLGIELGTSTLYVLAAFRKHRLRSSEAGLKYVLLGAISSGVLIYGISLVYGATGTTKLAAVATMLRDFAGTSPLAVIGAVMVVAGLSFKCVAAPFHMWAPDVYEGAPTPITGFLSVASKAAGFAVLLRVLGAGTGGDIGLAWLSDTWQPLVVALSAISMVLGNLVALQQRNIKRMLAYSGIAQAGYLLVAVAANSERGSASVAAYLFLYMFTNLGAFLTVAAVKANVGDYEIPSYRALSRRAPLLSLGLLILLLSLGGIPPLAGFVGKFHLFWSAVEQPNLWWLVLLGALMSVVSLYYYLMVIRQMYILEDAADTRPLTISPPLALAIWICVIATVVIGVWPRPLFGFALSAAAPMLPGG